MNLETLSDATEKSKILKALGSNKAESQVSTKIEINQYNDKFIYIQKNNLRFNEKAIADQGTKDMFISYILYLDPKA